MKNDHGYPLARGKMAEVWAKLICPVCDVEIEPVDDDYEYGLHLDANICNYCSIFVIYISPETIHEYHLVPDSQRWYTLEQA